MAIRAPDRANKSVQMYSNTTFSSNSLSSIFMLLYNTIQYNTIQYISTNHNHHLFMQNSLDSSLSVWLWFEGGDGRVSRPAIFYLSLVSRKFNS